MNATMRVKYDVLVARAARATPSKDARRSARRKKKGRRINTGAQEEGQGGRVPLAAVSLPTTAPAASRAIEQTHAPVTVGRRAVVAVAPSGAVAG